MKNTIGVFLIALLLCSFTGMSQKYSQTIKGTIIDKDSHIPLIGATIVILDSDPLIGGVTDLDGYFKLEGVPVGRYDLQITYIGYEPLIMNEVLVGSGREVVLNIGLKEVITNLKEVVIKAETSKDKPLNSMAMVSARSLSVEESSRYAGAMDDPARLASSFAGVATSIRSNGITIRGNAPKGMLWRLEGVQISNPSHLANLVSLGGGAVTALSSQMLDNSDFYTGAFPSEYGNALSGVFDIKLRTGNQDKREYTFGISLLGLDVSSEGPYVKGKRSTYLFNYRYSTFGLIQPLLPDDLGVLNYQDFSFKTNFPTKKTGVFSLWGLGARDYTTSLATENKEEWKYIEDREESKTKLYMGAFGLSHKLIVGKRSYVSSVVSFSGNGINWKVNTLDDYLDYQPTERVFSNTWKLSAGSYLNHKFSPRHTNRTGIVMNQLFYDIDLQQSPALGEPMNPVASANGNSTLLQGYSQSKIDVSEKVVLNAGFHVQLFTLDNQLSMEPRVGLQWNVTPRYTISLAYGKHSQLEQLQVYFSDVYNGTGYTQPNQGLEFSKAHHFVLGYDLAINEKMRLKVEPFYQRLYDIPVVPGTPHSMMNNESEWFINDSLTNGGSGTNIGIDFTLERFLEKGFYYLITASLFNSKYKGGDDIERNSRFNKNYVVNVLGGKEWSTGRGKNNIFGLNARLTLMGGDRSHPVDVETSHLEQDIVYDMSRAFEECKPDAQVLSMTISYRINKPHHSSVWSLQLMNMLAQPEMEGYRYNIQALTIDKQEDVIVVPNISYKIEF